MEAGLRLSHYKATKLITKMKTFLFFFLFAFKNTKTKTIINMARNYEPLVQVSFRTNRLKKERLEILAKYNNKSLSEYLDFLLDNYQDEINKRDEVIKSLKKLIEIMKEKSKG